MTKDVPFATLSGAGTTAPEEKSNVEVGRITLTIIYGGALFLLDTMIGFPSYSRLMTKYM